jgi:hypothetical protein
VGFQLQCVVSSQLTAEERHGVMAAALARWPFCRGPRDPNALTDRAVFAPPELTSYLFGHGEHGRYDEALLLADDVGRNLAEWSRAFPGVTFALIEANCFGGDCNYRGFCCRDGELIEQHDGRLGALIQLLAAVGIETHGYFAPFERGFFAGPGSGGFT